MNITLDYQIFPHTVNGEQVGAGTCDFQYGKNKAELYLLHGEKYLIELVSGISELARNRKSEIIFHWEDEDYDQQWEVFIKRMPDKTILVKVSTCSSAEWPNYHLSFEEKSSLGQFIHSVLKSANKVCKVLHYPKDLSNIVKTLEDTQTHLT